MAAALQAAMAAVLGEEERTDYTLVCGEKVFRVHSFVLISRSKFFRALLTNGMRESGERSTTVLVQSPEAVRAVVRYMYGINIPEDSAVIAEVLELADFYMMEDLKESVEAIACKTINQENYLKLYKTAEKLDDKKLISRCVDFVISEAEEVDMQAIHELPKVCLAAMELAFLKAKKAAKVGDRVRLSPAVNKPKYQWGDVEREEVGTITKILGQELRVKFPKCKDWKGVITEMEVEVAPGRWVRARAQEQQ